MKDSYDFTGAEQGRFYTKPEDMVEKELVLQQIKQSSLNIRSKGKSMSSIQQFSELPADAQQEVLDFMDYIALRRGIKLADAPATRPKWLAKINRGQGNGQLISETVVKERAEEKW